MSKRLLSTIIAVTAIVAVTAVVGAPRRSVLSQDGPTSTPTPKPPPPPTPTPKPPPPPTPTSKLPPMPTPDSTSSPTPTSVPTDVPQPQPPSPSPVPDVPELPGGRIELCVTGFSVYYHWQGLWTIVQWQAAEGDWRDVEGWRGTLDEITNGEGKKTWWVAEEGFGRGPFRWVVYSQSEGGRRLGVSKSFYLPQSAGEAVVVEISLQ